MPDENILIYVTFPTKKSAKKLSKKLVDKKMIACANIKKHAAIYSYQNKIFEEKEFSALLKTKEEKWDDVQAFILKNHPYDTPVILKIKIDDANIGFNEWVNETV